MKRIPVYRLVPEWKKAFKVLEDCCYEMVVYQGDAPERGVTERMDHDNELIGILLCCICDPEVKILSISEDEYNAILQEVNLRRAS